MQLKEPRKRKKEKLTIVIVPGNKSENAKNFTVGKFSLLLMSVSAIGLIAVFVIGLLIYTPLGHFLPITDPEIENRYGKQIIQVQEKLNTLINEIVVLRQYNLKLRKALGEKISDSDSILVERYTEPANEPKINLKTEPDVEIERVETTPLFGSDEKIFNPLRISTQGEFGMPDLPLTKPIDGLVTRDFNFENGHLGIDISGKEGSAIFASAPGTIIFADWSYDYGNMIILAHANGFRTVYKHNQRLLKTTGQTVRRGEPIALLGNTGKESTGPHLHFEIWKDEIAIDPKDYLLN
ncbi:MAG: M23 family metallopeptidase [Bacteroidota bacterium]|nr:M23 family metallopeptidase [Bacteroidota bacterium]